ncbi:glycerol-3-phosphate dehydrogenase [Pelagibacteraceae bacterium]|jgi:glycerol-3-phosphate dehydrogenase (NAD(P)+)|nr:glycerol-3-phosphate dehydrogenase [Pelagibacteraceae bacterium]
MSKIVIIGAGAMGSAFALPCLDNNHDINIIGTHLENEFIDNLKKNENFHPGLNTKIPQELKIFKFEKFEELMKSKVDLIVLGISSKGIEWVSDQLSHLYKNSKIPKILMLTKGLSIYNNQYELLIDKLERLLSVKGITNVDISAVGGPCLAAGLANRINSSVVIANKDLQTAKKIADMLNTHYYHTSHSNDLNGVEVSAAIKNIFSMAVGAAKGLCSKNASNEVKEKNYLNTASALIKQSIHEMEIFVEHLKGNKETVKGLAGLGDLYVSSGGGRNAKMGFYIGEGLTFSEAKKTKMQKVTVEGADLAKEIAKKVNEDFDQKKLPLMLGMINAIVDDKKLVLDWESFR